MDQTPAQNRLIVHTQAQDLWYLDVVLTYLPKTGRTAGRISEGACLSGYHVDHAHDTHVAQPIAQKALVVNLVKKKRQGVHARLVHWQHVTASFSFFWARFFCLCV